MLVEKIDGFTIELHEEEEYSCYRDDLSFENTGCDHSETFEAIENGELIYFTAKVTASKNGIELSSDYLGSCIYKDLEDFKNNSGYYEQMVAETIKDAQIAIMGLCNDL